jgi:hypothetical protein
MLDSQCSMPKIPQGFEQDLGSLPRASEGIGFHPQPPIAGIADK